MDQDQVIDDLSNLEIGTISEDQADSESETDLGGYYGMDMGHLVFSGGPGMSLEQGRIVGISAGNTSKFSILWELCSCNPASGLADLLKLPVPEHVEEIVLFRQDLEQPVGGPSSVQVYKSLGSNALNVRLVLKGVCEFIENLDFKLEDHTFSVSLLDQRGGTLIEKYALGHYIAGNAVFEVPKLVPEEQLESDGLLGELLSTQPYEAILLVLSLVCTQSKMILKPNEEQSSDVDADEEDNDLIPTPPCPHGPFNCLQTVDEIEENPFKGFLKRGNLCDGKIELKVSKESNEIISFQIHRMVLASQSKKLDELLQDTSTVVIENHTVQAVDALLDYMYGEKSASMLLVDMDFQHLKNLLELAEDLAMFGLESKFRTWFPKIKNKMVLSEFVDLYKMADDWEALPLKKLCLAYFEENQQELNDQFPDFVEKFGITELLLV